MNTHLVIVGFQTSVLISVAMMDIAARLIPNKVCMLIASLGIAGQVTSDARQLPQSFAAAGVLFLTLLLVYQRGWMGGGDVKFLVALAIGLPVAQLIPLFMMISLAGGLLGVIHLILRHLPRPARSPAGASYLRRVYAVERWRNLRRAPLPYGVAIAGGAIWIIVSSHGA